ncbi:HTH-type transcriptional repressor NsrR [Enhygromyxa salina]|uniref:HTH-type transcriptional repressor NsrR n=1 Tax=Enhygromyxa salina TaxID=215803 RepID=A0A2S9YF84_9BACT|nr:Rrf2 family transcriptional regulator [Enhygromyxa salina]PRQ03701.1 HTH-type transcriptional repressor NsrR [Enhygromyxa salina]
MLSKTAEYALRATVWLAREPGKTEPAARLASCIRVPRRYLHKVLQDLVAAGLVHSRPGPGGGYTLSHDPAEISILDVVNAVEPIPRIHDCPLGLSTHTSLCPLHQALDQSYAAMEESLGKVSVADLLHQPSRVPPLVEITKTRSKRTTTSKS